MTLHREAAVFGDKIFQICMVDSLKQLFKGLSREVRQHDQHPFAGAQADIGLGHVPRFSGKQHPAVFHPDVGDIQPPQLVAGNASSPNRQGTENS